jgi:hypothetical protein
MGIVHTDCPHCGAAMVGMPTYGVYVITTTAPNQNIVIQPPDVLTAARCPICSKPISALLSFKNRAATNANSFHSQASAFSTHSRVPETDGLELKATWPKAQGPDIPRHMPQPLSDKLLEAERSFRANINTGAASLYRAVVDTTTKRQLEDVGLSSSGTLDSRVKRLADNHAIPAAVADWAHEVRVIANEALHDEPVVTRDDAEMVRSFALTYLRYAFELPGDIATRRTPSATAAD